MAATPREVFEALVNGIAEHRYAELADLYAEDCVVEVPFALPEPIRMEGRATLAAHFDPARRMPLEISVDNVRVYETADPEFIVAEWDYHIRVSTTGKELTVANVQLMRVRDGKIVFTRDFHNHAALAAAMS